MHEVQIMESVVKGALTEAKKKNAESVSKLVLEIGELTFLGPEQLQFAYEVLTKGTIMEGSELEIVTVKGVTKCPECEKEGPLQYSDDPQFHNAFPIFTCPDCAKRLEVLSGNECTIKTMRMNIPDEE